MEYEIQNVISLYIDAGCIFSSTDHYPLVAGYTAGGEPLYDAWLTIPGAARTYARIAIPSGIRPERVTIKVHNADGSITLIQPSDATSLSVNALRYDPHAYDLNEYYSKRGKEECDMDSTGPFSWKFYKRLPVIQTGKKVMWEEALIETDEEEISVDSVHIGEDDNVNLNEPREERDVAEDTIH